MMVLFVNNFFVFAILFNTIRYFLFIANLKLFITFYSVAVPQKRSCYVWRLNTAKIKRPKHKN